MITETNVKLNVSKMNVLKDVFAKQKDSNSRFLNCVFFDGDGRRFIPITQGDIVINAERSDGLYHSFVGSINADGSVRVPMTNWMLDKAGELTCSVTIYEGSEKLTTAAFRIFVEKAENPDGAISPDDPSTDVAQQLVLRAEAAAAQAEEAVETIDSAFDGAGIRSKSYTTVFDTETVTTTQSSMYSSFHALLENGKAASLLLEYNSNYKVSFDNVEYVLPAQCWFVGGVKNNWWITHDVVILGNVKLWGEDIGFYTEIPDVPFLLTQQTGELEDYGLHLFTETGGDHTIKIEKISYDKTVFPNILMYGEMNPPIFNVYSHPIYKERNCFSLGYNDLRSKRTTAAIGGKNVISGDNSVTIGQNNTASGIMCVVAGSRNTASGDFSCALNEQNVSAGRASSVFGYRCQSLGTASTAIGRQTTANHAYQFVFGRDNIPDPSESAATANGNYIEIVGNGTSTDNRSNARTLDWDGNEALAGGLTLGKGTADEVTLSAAQLKQLIALLN